MYKALSTGLLGFGGRSLKDDIPLAVKYGYDGILIDIKAVSAQYSPAEFCDLMSENKLKPAGFGLPVDFRGGDDVFETGLRDLRSICEFAEKTGTARCNTWIMPCHETLDYAANFRLHRERLTPIAKILEQSGITLGLEFVGPKTLRKNKPYEFIHDLKGLNELIDAVGTSSLGYLLDVFHWDTAGQVFDDFKNITNRQVALVHINDGVKGVSLDEQLDGKRELPGAAGVLKIGEFFRGLLNMNYDGPVAVEPFSAALKAMNAEDAVRAAKAATDKVWPVK